MALSDSNDHTSTLSTPKSADDVLLDLTLNVDQDFEGVTYPAVLDIPILPALKMRKATKT